MLLELIILRSCKSLSFAFPHCCSSWCCAFWRRHSVLNRLQQVFLHETQHAITPFSYHCSHLNFHFAVDFKHSCLCFFTLRWFLCPCVLWDLVVFTLDSQVLTKCSWRSYYSINHLFDLSALDSAGWNEYCMRVHYLGNESLINQSSLHAIAVKIVWEQGSLYCIFHFLSSLTFLLWLHNTERLMLFFPLWKSIKCGDIYSLLFFLVCVHVQVAGFVERPSTMLEGRCFVRRTSWWVTQLSHKCGLDKNWQNGEKIISTD